MVCKGFQIKNVEMIKSLPLWLLQFSSFVMHGYKMQSLLECISKLKKS